MKIEGDQILFSSGKKLYANNGIIGINRNLEAYGGYDDTLISCLSGSDSLSPKERAELSEYMIKLWKEYADQK